MEKNELLKHVKEAINTEESATTIYYEHLYALASKINTDDPFVKELQKDVKYLIKFNIQHKKICEDIYQQIKQDAANDL